MAGFWDYLKESGQSLGEGAQYIMRALGDVAPLYADPSPPNREMTGLASGLLEAPMAVGAPLRVPQRPMAPAKMVDKPTIHLGKTALSPASDHVDLLGPGSPLAEGVAGWPFGPHPTRRMDVPQGPITIGKPTAEMRPGDPDHGATMAEMQELAKRFGFGWSTDLVPGQGSMGEFWPGRNVSMHPSKTPGGGTILNVSEEKVGDIKLLPKFEDNVARSLVSAHELSHGIDWKSMPGYGNLSTPEISGSAKRGKVLGNPTSWRAEHTQRPDWKEVESELRDAGSLVRYATDTNTRASAVNAADYLPEGPPLTRDLYDMSLVDGWIGEPTKEIWADSLALYLVDPRFMKANFPKAAAWLREKINPSEVGKWLQLNAGPALLAGGGATAGGLLAPGEAFADDQLQDENLREVME